jgi:hypothetical protein
MHQSLRCGARTRRGSPCQSPAMANGVRHPAHRRVIRMRSSMGATRPRRWTTAGRLPPSCARCGSLPGKSEDRHCGLFLPVESFLVLGWLSGTPDRLKRSSESDFDSGGPRSAKEGTMTTPIEMTRQQLYDLVWSKPTHLAAADMPMSQISLKKLCSKHGVPVPPHGYWQKSAERQAEGKIPLPPTMGDQRIWVKRFLQRNRQIRVRISTRKRWRPS